MTPDDMRQAAKAVQKQYELDHAEAGAPAPYNVMGYKGSGLKADGIIIDEFSHMRKIVDGFSEPT